MDFRGQGALEYLIIIAAVLAIAAIVVVVLSGAFGGGQKSATVGKLQTAASTCSKTLSAEGETVGEPNGAFCNSTCSEWDEADISAATVTTEGLDEIEGGDTNYSTVYNKDPAWIACISGRPGWIREAA